MRLRGYEVELGGVGGGETSAELIGDGLLAVEPDVEVEDEAVARLRPVNAGDAQRLSGEVPYQVHERKDTGAGGEGDVDATEVDVM